MRLLSFILLLLAGQLVIAQLSIQPISKKEKTYTQARNAQISPATLPFWDDFSISGQSVDSVRVWDGDSLFQWDYEFSKSVFVNSTLAINPPTYNVATLDGLDENGVFYVKSNDAVGPTDQLVSTIIDMSGKTNNDGIYLSFYWQAGGNVELPEMGDSLVFQVLDPDSVWTTLWMQEGVEGMDREEFNHVLVPIDESNFHDKFRFRFQAYGDQDGPFDAWHLDWIYFNEDRSTNVAVDGYIDGGFTGQLSSPFEPFNSMPVHQFGGNPNFVRNQTVGTRSLNLLPGEAGFFSVSVNYSLTNTNTGTLIAQDFRGYPLLASVTRLDTLLTLGQFDPGAAPFLYLFDEDFSSVTTLDSVVLRTEISMVEIADVEGDKFLDGSNVDLRVNDTIRHDYLLHDYYAFDDGTAEFAAGTNIRNGQVAVQYWVQQADTLSHVDIHFPNISPIQQSDPVLTLKILKNLDDEFPLRDQQITVKSDSSRNGFTRYTLERPVVVSDTFYVAYQQFINDYISIGFDRSNTQASPYIFENTNGDWIQNISLQGALMIRPVFQNGIEWILGVEPKEEIHVYPNPTLGMIKIPGNYDKIELLDLSGKVLFVEQMSPHHDITKFEEGLYLLRIHQNQTYQVKKIILR